MRALILSDIHGNLEALQAVLAAADGLWDELWNLGDLVGYGASPNQVIDLVRPLESLVVRGNHDRVCAGLTSPNGFNPVARAAALWTRAELTPEHVEWLKSLPQGPLQPGHEAVCCAHGSPLNEDQYILSMRDAWAPLQQMNAPVTFFGHTHVQGGFSQKEHDWHEIRPQYPSAPLPAKPRTAAEPRKEPSSWAMPLPEGTRHLINPGSVGQPRDYDWRAAFAVMDTDLQVVTFHRVPYDLVASQGRILMAGLPERLAARLREGR